ncbi:MAG: type II secretion system protein GspN [Deltaproteobacteria bacterium]|nr:type II secretion system protein GspN [Deltaproteobacteria bacterium]MBW2129848.1 type II secretion system protein GspN [Deltaproteobacteria bacterium]MBW2304106.1 type II secretion system protein GspN [Deltaproteobacteria bacterium]
MESKRKIGFFILLGVYGSGLFIALTLFRLPVEKLIASAVSDISGGKIAIRVERVSFAFPDRIRLKNITAFFFQKDQPVECRFHKIDLRPRYRDLFSGLLPVWFHAELADGELEGYVGVSLSRGVKHENLDLDATGLRLERLDWISALSNRKIKGKLNAHVHLEGNLKDPAQVQGKGRLSVEDGAVETILDLPGMASVPFDVVEAPFLLRDGRIFIEKGEMRGPMFSGSFSGIVKLRMPLKRSRPRIEVRLAPGARLADHPLGKWIFERIKNIAGPLSVHIGGTFETPVITWSTS